MEIGYKGGRAGVPSWFHLTHPVWNSRNIGWKYYNKVVNLELTGDAQWSDSCDYCKEVMLECVS